MNPLDQQFDPVFLGGQDRRPRQRFTGGNQPPQPIQQPYGGNFQAMTGGNLPAIPVRGMATGGPAQQAPWMGMQTGGPAQPGIAPAQQTGGGFAPMLQRFTGGQGQQMPLGGFAGNLWRSGNFGRFGYR